MAGKKRLLLLIAFISFITGVNQFAQQPAAATVPMSADTQSALLKQYCQGCHNDTTRSGNMSLTALDLAHVDQDGALTEKIIKKLRAGLMPPAGARRPDAGTVKAFVATLETTMDKAAAANPNPGARPSQRLTRTENAHSIPDMFGAETAAKKYLT